MSKKDVCPPKSLTTRGTYFMERNRGGTESFSPRWAASLYNGARHQAKDEGALL